MPDGPERGNEEPANVESTLKEIQRADIGNGGSQEPLNFRIYDELGDATPSAHIDNPEPSVAENGQTIMTTGNFWMSLSTDGGSTFTTVNPTTIFPQDYGGFCCDQVVTYVPEFDLFVWLLQYSGSSNAIRIAVQTTDQVRASDGQAWTYWDFTNSTFASSGALDYNDMSFGKTFLYWSSSVGLRLSDGGLYDNLGLEPVWKSHLVVLVSEGGSTFDAGADGGLLWRLNRYMAIQGRGGGAVRKRWLDSASRFVREQRS